MRDGNMFPAQIAKIKPDEFSRCEELAQKTNHGKNLSLRQKTDAAIKGSMNYALWKQLQGCRSLPNQTRSPMEQLRDLLLRLSEDWSRHCTFQAEPLVPW